jgi:hypothetical protein
MEGPQETPVATETVTGPSKRPLSDERLKVLAATRLKAAEVRKARSKERQDAKTLQAQEQAQLVELQRMEKAAKMLEVQRRTEELRRQMSPERVAYRSPKVTRRSPVSRQRSPKVTHRSPTGRAPDQSPPTPRVPTEPQRLLDLPTPHERLYMALFGGP